jgi:hypothetical protein
MWMCLGPSCLDRPFSEELGDAEINTRIHRVLAHGVILNPGASPAPLREGVDSTRVSPFAIAFGNLRHLICSWRSCPPIGPCAFSQCTTGGHLTLGRGEAGSVSCPQLMVERAKIEEATLECRPDGGEGTGRENTLRA